MYAFHDHTQVHEMVCRETVGISACGCADECLVARKVVNGKVGRQNPAGSDIMDTEVPQPCGGNEACMSCPVDVEDDNDDDRPAGVCGHQPAAYVCAMLALGLIVSSRAVHLSSPLV